MLLAEVEELNSGAPETNGKRRKKFRAEIERLMREAGWVVGSGSKLEFSRPSPTPSEEKSAPAG